MDVKKNRKHTGGDTSFSQAIKSEKVNSCMIKHAREIAQDIGANAVLVYVDVIKSLKNIETLVKDRKCILAARTQSVIDGIKGMEDVENRILRIPQTNLTRLSQVKVAAVLALTNRLVNASDRIVCLTGSLAFGMLDHLMIVDMAKEFQTLFSSDLAATRHMEFSHVFDRLMTLVLELAEEGKEGKPLGTIFVWGDHEKVMELSSQMVFNPFAGVPENERNIMDPRLKESIREFAGIDGAFVIRDDGVILAAGRHLKAFTEDESFPQGLGSRHHAAAGITALTKALAIAISQSTGDVRIFSGGKLLMEIEKAGKERSGN